MEALRACLAGLGYLFAGAAIIAALGAMVPERTEKEKAIAAYNHENAFCSMTSSCPPRP